MGVITFSNMEEKFGTLCNARPVALLPFGGRYRLIDFSISSMVAYNIKTIGAFTGTKIQSVIDHIGSGKPWDLNRRFNGLFIFSPFYDNSSSKNIGNINLFYNNESFFRKAIEENIFICNTDMLLKIDMEAAYDHFLNTDADITVIYKKATNF